MRSGFTWGAKSPVSLRVCPLCHQQGLVFKSGRLKHGPQRYICRSCNRTFQQESLKRQVNKQRVIELYLAGKSHTEITAETGVSSSTISRIASPFRARRNGQQCPACESENVSRFGKTKSGQQRFRCKDCLQTFNGTQRQPNREDGSLLPGSVKISDGISEPAMLELDGVLYEAKVEPHSDNSGTVYAPVITPQSHYSVHTFAGEADPTPVAVAPDLSTAVEIARLAISYAVVSPAAIVIKSSWGVTHENPLEWLCEV